MARPPVAPVLHTVAVAMRWSISKPAPSLMRTPAAGGGDQTAFPSGTGTPRTQTSLEAAPAASGRAWAAGRARGAEETGCQAAQMRARRPADRRSSGRRPHRGDASRPAFMTRRAGQTPASRVSSATSSCRRPQGPQRAISTAFWIKNEYCSATKKYLFHNDYPGTGRRYRRGPGRRAVEAGAGPGRAGPGKEQPLDETDEPQREGEAPRGVPTGGAATGPRRGTPR